MDLSNQIVKEKLLNENSELELNSQEIIDDPSIVNTNNVSFQLSFEEKDLDKQAPLIPKKEENLINQQLLDGLSNKELKEIISHIQLRRDSPALINIDQMASVLNDASPELAAEILRGIDWAHASQIIAKIRDRSAVGNLYRLSPGAEGLMKAEVVGLRSEWPISHALSVLRKSGLNSPDLQNLFVVDKGGLLLGSIDLPDLVFSDPRKHVRDVMSINTVSAELGTDREKCARLMETHGLRAIPVVNNSGVLQGVISIEELVQVAEDEATEDMFKMVGMSIQRCGIEEVAASLNSEDVTLILALRESEDTEIVRLRELAESKGIPVIEGSKSDLWRMARRNDGDEPPGILALVGRKPDTSVEEVFSAGGLVWLLAGARYPVNIGFTIRTAEVSGSDAVFVDGALNHDER